MTTAYHVDPLTDSRWAGLLARHRLSTVFHSSAWLDALRRTYGYGVSALTTSSPGCPLENALVFCHVKSWLTGRRVVSVPFADHCTPLVNSGEELTFLLSCLKSEYGAKGKQYIEIRPVDSPPVNLAGFSESSRFLLHKLDLRPSLDVLMKRLHPSCIRRRLLRAMKENFVYEEGRTETMLRHFYQLALITRRRQNLPPQPLAWFQNLIRCLGEQLKIRLLFHSGQPAAAILTIRFQETMTYKYGVSDARFHQFGSMQLLLWKAIEEAKSHGLSEFDMGRTECTNRGLAVFKDRWGCSRSLITHLRYPAEGVRLDPDDRRIRIARQLFGLAPDRVLATAGSLLYRHMA